MCMIYCPFCGSPEGRLEEAEYWSSAKKKYGKIHVCARCVDKLPKKPVVSVERTTLAALKADLGIKTPTLPDCDPCKGLGISIKEGVECAACGGTGREPDTYMAL
jgi:hypothetical protein